MKLGQTFLHIKITPLHYRGVTVLGGLTSNRVPPYGTITFNIVKVVDFLERTEKWKQGGKSKTILKLRLEKENGRSFTLLSENFGQLHPTNNILKFVRLYMKENKKDYIIKFEGKKLKKIVGKL